MGTIFLVIVILSSILAAGIVQDMFAGEAGEGESGGDDWRLLLPCVLETFVRIYTYYIYI